MSSTLINRSLANIRTELEFLVESGVISQQQSQQILSTLPSSADRAGAPRPGTNTEYVEALYAFQAQQEGDLSFKAGEKIEVLEKPSAEWYKGRCNGAIGMFPSNYVKPAFGGHIAPSAPVDPAPPRYQVQPQDTAHSSSSSYTPAFPPASTNYYQHPPQNTQYAQPPVQYAAPVPYQQPLPPPQVQQQPVKVVEAQGQGSGASSTFKKYGSQLGSAAVFGAGATIGADLVHSIF